MRLGVSAVRHDMKREETVEEVEKNTELERCTPNEADWQVFFQLNIKQLLLG